MNTENSSKPAKKAKLVATATTGIICAMGGYICGDKIDEIDKLEQAKEPYDIASSLLKDAKEKQNEWLRNEEQFQKNITSYEIKIDSLERITAQLENCQYELETQNREHQQCKDNFEILVKQAKNVEEAYRNEMQEVKIRDNQIDSLEDLVKNYKKENLKLQDEYEDRSPIENEFQAIHNCINAQGNNMDSYTFNRQTKCCIKALKEMQKKYPKDKFKNILLKCNDH